MDNDGIVIRLVIVDVPDIMYPELFIIDYPEFGSTAVYRQLRTHLQA